MDKKKPVPAKPVFAPRQTVPLTVLTHVKAGRESQAKRGGE